MKKGVAFLVALACYGAAPVVTPSTPPVVKVSQTQAFMADQPVTWSLGAGSKGSIDAGGTYTAPSSVIHHNIADSCPIYPNDAVFNTNISALPAHASSGSWIGQFGATHIDLTETSFWRNVITNASPTEDLYLRYGVTPGAGPYPFHIPAGTNSITDPSDFSSYPYLIEGGLYADPYNGPDRHLVSVNQDGCGFEEIYKPYAFGTNPECNMIMVMCNAQSAVSFPYGYDLPGGTDAAGLPLTPLSVRYSEVRGCIDDGVPIKHAMRLTFANGYLNNSFLWPATANSTSGGGLIPYGARLRLKSSVDISSYTAGSKCILQALKDYGAFASDGGITFHFQIAADLTYLSEWKSIVTEISAAPIVSTDTEFIDESSLRTSDTHSGYASARVDPSNGYVTPSDFATVCATNGSLQTTCVAVALQGVTIGTYQESIYLPSYPVMAGASQFALPVHVHGSSNTAFACTAQMGAVGTLTSSGLYTAPTAQSNAVNSVTATCIASADALVSSKTVLYVLPDTVLRIDLGGVSAGAGAWSPPIPYSGNNYGPDTNGAYWFGWENGFSLWNPQDTWYMQSGWSATPNVGLWVTYEAYLGDLFYVVRVPNGSYTVAMLAGVKPDNGGGSFASNAYVSSTEVNWLRKATNVDLCSLTIPTCTQGYPGQYTYSGNTISNGILSLALRYTTDGKYPVLGGFSAALELPPPPRLSGRVAVQGRAKIQ